MIVGKQVFDDLYVHLSAVQALDAPHREAIAKALEVVAGASPAPNVAKVNVRSSRLSLLAYPDFEQAPFPVLAASWQFNRGTANGPVFRSYGNSLNPPILHRKELLVAPDHPDREKWSRLTRTAEELGLFDDTSAIGFQMNWEQSIRSKGYTLVGDSFVPQGNDVPADAADLPSEGVATVQRHLTALARSSLSAPVQLLLRHGLLEPGKTFFDYGCGRGDDMTGLAANCYAVGGWDPHYAPDRPRAEADVINLGFVVNVIEDPAERVEAIRKAFALTKEVLAIGVMLYGGEMPGNPFRDGFLTSRNTFQKYFTQGEFKDYIEHVLNREAFMVAPGVCFVFAQGDLEQRFSAGRYRSSSVAARLLSLRIPGSIPRQVRAERLRVPRERIERSSRARRVSRVEAFMTRVRPTLDKLWAITLELGRVPEPDEVANLEQVLAELGSLKRAIRLMHRNFDARFSWHERPGANHQCGRARPVNSGN